MTFVQAKLPSAVTKPILLPPSRRAAGIFVGTELQVWWEKTENTPAGWYNCTVSDVPEQATAGYPKAIFLCCRYEDGDGQDHYLQELNGEQVNIVKLSPAAQSWLEEQATPPLAVQASARKRRKPNKGAVQRTAQEYLLSQQEAAPTGRSRSQEAADSLRSSMTSQLVQPEPANPASDAAAAATKRWEPAARPATPAGSQQAEEGAPRAQGNKGRKQQQQEGPTVHQPQDDARFIHVQEDERGGKAGQVLSLKLENFMCHRNFQINFCPHVNFISGQNGSGKSALLQSMQFCLGVGARASGRAAKMQELVHPGASHAKASLTLCNIGGEAFRPGYFGPSITIEREIRASTGTSSYTIRRHDGSKADKSTARDVAAIRDAFSADISNPAICLTQDMARTFAGSASSTEKYEKYMEAMHFTRIIESLDAARFRISDMEEGIFKFAKQHKGRREKLEEMQRLCESMTEVKDWKELVDHVRNCRAWSHAHAAAAELTGLQHKLEVAVPRARHEAEAGLAEAQTALTEVLSEYDRQHAAFQAFGGRLEALVTARGNLRQAHQDANRQLSRLNTQIRQLDSDVGSARELHQAAVAALDSAQARLAQSSQSAADQHEQRAAQRRHISQQMEAADTTASTARQGLREAEAFKQDKARRRDEAAREVRDAAAARRDLETRLSSITSSDSPVVKFGGPSMVRLLDSIRVNSHHFHHLPIGPVGAQLALQDDCWAYAVEAAIGGKIFNFFIVHDHHDLQELRGLLARASLRNTSVIICSFDMPPHNMARQQQVPPHFTTIERVLTVKEQGQRATVLKNVLLDHAAIERQALVQNVREGMARVQDRAIRQAWALDGGHTEKRLSSVTSFPDPPPLTPRLARDLTQLQTQLQRQRSDALAVEQTARAALTAAEAAVAEADQALTEARMALGQAEALRRDTHNNMSQLQSQLMEEVFTGEGEEDMSGYHADVADADARLQEAIRQRESEQHRIDAAQQQVASAKAAKDAKEADVRAITAENEACNAAISEVAGRKQAGEDAVADWQTKAERLQELVANLTRNIAEKEQDVSQHRQHGMEACSQEEEAASMALLQSVREMPEQPAERQQHLERISQDLHRKIRTSERRAGRSFEDLEAESERLQRRIDKEGVQLHVARLACQLLWTGLSSRRSREKDIRATEYRNVNFWFNKHLKRRRHAGKIKIDYHKHELDLEVEVDKASHGQTATNLKSLSGGERSFSTLAFVLAMGRSILAPFHCLDEFDVFLDAQNRQTAIRLLIECAVTLEDTQFILLSPQDVRSIQHAKEDVQTRTASASGMQNLDDFVKIVQLDPPDRARGRTA